ncbi:MAG: ribosomal protein S18-alanine N-acetyltransferase [Tenericutes bacterium]|nr:ribosomal protein S18-alanine N-acetyltransferase [Mycoplasmatota bacterium]
MIEFVIRDMLESDVPTVVKYDTIMLGVTLGDESLREHLNDSSIMKYFIMETKDSKQFIGHISLWIDEDLAQINNFYIIHKYQKQGLGKSLLEFVMRYFNSLSIREVTLEVRKSNDVAINLYKKYDFKQITIRKNYYKNGEDAIFMYLRIGSD